MELKLEASNDDVRRIEELIADPQSPVGIDAIMAPAEVPRNQLTNLRRLTSTIRKPLLSRQPKGPEQNGRSDSPGSHVSTDA